MGKNDPPHLVLPLTVESTKPRFCIDAKFLNLWTRDVPFTLDRLADVPRFVYPSSFLTKCDDKSRYDHVLLNCGFSLIVWVHLWRVTVCVHYIAVWLEDCAVRLSYCWFSRVWFPTGTGCSVLFLHWWSIKWGVVDFPRFLVASSRWETETVLNGYG